ncbi:MAG: immunoglobulin-like domain-containing protein, partial [Lachnospiraceae bacterium]
MMRKLRQDKKKQHSIRQMSKRMLSLVLAASLAFPAANFAAVGTLAGTSVEAALKPSATETIDGVTYSTYSFDVAENIVTQEGKSASDLYGGKTMTIGRGRCLYLQYDITGLEELLANGSVVTEAKIAMTRSGSAGNQSNVHFIKDNSWIENASHIDYASGNAPAYEKFVLGSTSTVGISGEFTIDVTDVFYRYESDVESALSFMVTGSKTDGTDPTVTDENGLDVYTKYNGSEVPRIDITIAKISKETAEKQVALTRAKLAAGVLTNQLGGKEMVKDFSLIRDMSLYLGDASTTVAWTCDSPYVQISEDGNKALVTRPGVEDEDDEVTLYAHISYNGQTYTKKIKVMVLKESSEVRVQPSQQWFIQNGATADLNGPEYMENKGIDGKTTAIGRGRETLMSIPLEEIDENATKVELYYWNTNGNNTTTIDTNVYTFDSTVDVSSLSYNAVHALDLTSVGTFTLVKKAEQGVIDLTKAVLDAKKAGDTNINLLFDGSWSTTTTIAQIAGITYDLDETKRPYLTFSIEEIESRLPEAVEIVKSLDGTIHTEDFLFPDVSSISGASVEWSVDANDYLDINADGSEAYVYRPAKDAAGDAEVTLHALVKWGDESQEVDVTVIIPKERTISPYLRPSLERMLNRVELLLQLAEEDTVYSAEVLSKDFNEYLLKTEVPVYENAGTAYGEQVVRKTEATVPRIDLTVDDADRQLGQLSVVAYQELKTAYDTAKDVYDNGTETQYSPEIQNLIRKGKAFVGSGKTDDSLYTNKVSDADLWKLPAVASDDSSTSKNARRYEKVTILPGDELAYSTYRAFEESLVWESYALLEVEPELYPQSAKDALQQKIDDAEKALNGTYYLMMAKSRQFFQSRPDEYIQRTTLYQSKVWNFESFEYGLQRSMQWYRNQ